MTAFSWPRDNERELNRFFGDPARTGDVEKHLIKVVPPFQMYYAGKPVKSLLFHERAAPALLAALNDVWDKCGRSQATVDKLGISKTAGTYNKRKIAGTDRWSSHSRATAIDINAEQNGFFKGKGNIPAVLIAAFDAVRFRWGGRYRGRTDPMHFEAIDPGFAAPAGFLGLDLSAFEGVFERWAGEPHEKGCILCEPDFDGGDHDGEDERPSLFRRIRNWLAGGATTTIGGGTLAYFTDWRVVVVLAVSFFVLLGLIVWFFGADNVRRFVRKQIGAS